MTEFGQERCAVVVDIFARRGSIEPARDPGRAAHGGGDHCGYHREITMTDGLASWGHLRVKAIDREVAF